MKKNLILIGTSQFAEIAYEYFTHDSAYEIKGFAVEKAFLTRDQLFGLPVVAFEEMENHFSPETHEAFVAVTFIELNRVRARLYAQTKAKGFRLANYVSSKAFVWKNVKMGDNIFIFEDNTVQPFVTLENNIILWSGNHIGHHSHIESDCFISSHVVISGNCRIGARSFIGVNSTISNNVTIGEDNFLGLSSIIARSTEVNSVIMATPSEVRSIKATTYCKVRE